MSPLKLNGSTSGFVALDAPAAAGSNTLVLPTGNGSNGQVLTTNGSGTLSWSTVASSQWTTSGSDINYTTGKVLVGTSTSRNDFFNNTTTVAGGIQLELSASDNLNRFMSFTSNNSDTGGPSFLFGKSRGTTANSKTVVQSDDQLAAFNFHGADGSDMVEAARISAHVDGTPGTNDMPGRLVFSTTADGASSPTERMRITSDGYVGIGATARLGNGGIFFRNNVSAGAGEISFNRADTASTSTVIAFYNNTNTVGTITHTNAATAYNTSSDYRLKENVEPVSDGIARLQQLKPSRFNFIVNPGQTVDGFIAHEVQDVVPEAITGEKDAVDDDGNPKYQGIDQSKLVPLLTAALQEAIGRIETLEANNAALEARLSALEVTP